MAFIGDENAQLRSRPIQTGKEDAMKRRPILHLFENRISKERKRLEGLAAELQPGSQRDGILKKIGQLNTAIHIDEWLSSPGLQTPR
jgi:hypothetical protein